MDQRDTQTAAMHAAPDPLSKATRRRITFRVDGEEVVGHLYTPSDFDPARSYPAVVTAGSLTSTKEMMGGRYAGELADRGLVALAIDYRHYGESGGKPRQYEDPIAKREDLKGAVTYLLEQDYVSGVGALGVCTSGGTVAYLGADDDRVGAIASIAAWIPNPEVLPVLYGGEDGVAQLRQAGKEARAKYERSGENDLIPAYSDTDQTASHVGPMQYYMDKQRGGGIKGYRNALAVQSWNNWLDFAPLPLAGEITVPYLMIESDDCALPDNARAYFRALGSSDKQLLWRDTGAHFDFYDQDPQVRESADAVAEFFKSRLAPA